MTISAILFLILTIEFEKMFQVSKKVHKGIWPHPLVVMIWMDQICFSYFCRSPYDHFWQINLFLDQ